MNKNIPKSIAQKQVDSMGIKNNTLFFKDSIYQISNISAFEMREMKSLEAKNYPGIVLALGLMSIVLFISWLVFSGWWILLASILLIISSLNIHFKYKPEIDVLTYGIGIKLNSGHETILITKRKEFASKAVFDLQTIIFDQSKNKDITIDFKNESIQLK